MPLSRSGLDAALAAASNHVAELSIGGQTVDGGWAYVGNSAAVYCVGSGDAIPVVGVHLTGQPTSDDSLIAAITMLAQALDVWIVEWSACSSHPDILDA